MKRLLIVLNLLKGMFCRLKLKDKPIGTCDAAQGGDPDPTPGSDGHFLPFNDVYGTDTTEKHRPSAKKRSSKQRTLPFHSTCEECQHDD